MHRVHIRSTAAVCLVLAASPLAAGELGHYGGGAFNPRDYPVGPPGLYFGLFGSSYATDTLRDAAGQRIDSIDFGPAGSVGLDVDISTQQGMLAITWATGAQLFGADLGMLAMPVYGETSVAATLSAFGEGSATFETPTGRAFYDTLVLPLHLNWKRPQGDLGFALFAFAPTGRYEPEAGDNTGLGFWSAGIRTHYLYYPDEHRLNALLVSLSWETNGRKEETDLTPGDHLTLDLAYSRFLGQRFEVGAFAWGQWQTSADSGRDAVAPADRDRAYAGGIYGFWHFRTPGQEPALNLRIFREFGARDRTEGLAVALGLVLPFPRS